MALSCRMREQDYVASEIKRDFVYGLHLVLVGYSVSCVLHDQNSIGDMHLDYLVMMRDESWFLPSSSELIEASFHHVLS